MESGNHHHTQLLTDQRNVYFQYHMQLSTTILLIILIDEQFHIKSFNILSTYRCHFSSHEICMVIYLEIIPPFPCRLSLYVSLLMSVVYGALRMAAK